VSKRRVVAERTVQLRVVRAVSRGRAFRYALERSPARPSAARRRRGLRNNRHLRAGCPSRAAFLALGRNRESRLAAARLDARDPGGGPYDAWNLAGGRPAVAAAFSISGRL